jgi:hypothetical protein
MSSPPPPITPPNELQTRLAATGWAVLDAGGLAACCGLETTALAQLRPFWLDLPLDPHLRDGGRYRRRRHGCCIVDGDAVVAAPHRAHWQPVEYNALHGGIERWFEPLDSAMPAHAAWPRLLCGLAHVASGLRGVQRWFVEAHVFRIDTTDGIGRPTPEGAHRDGVDLVAVVMVDRQGVKGGETRVFDARGPQGVRFSLVEPWSVLLLDDERVIHETTPIQPLDPRRAAWRDTLVLTFRRGGFQGPELAARSEPGG